MDQIVIQYYENNAKKLRNIVDKILLRFGGLSNKDLDDFYSLANEVFVDVMRRYDDSRSQPFDSFLQSCLSKRIKTEITRRNREKRKIDQLSISIDTPVGDNENSTIGDGIVGDFDLEREVFGEENNDTSKIEKYMSRLSKRQRRIAELLAASYGAGEIQKILQITQQEYSDAMIGIRYYDNIAVLF